LHGRFVVFIPRLAPPNRLTAAQATYEAARYVPVVSTTVALAVGVANLSRQYGAYGIAGFLHRADIAKVSVCACLWLCKMHKHGKHTRLVRVHGSSAVSFAAFFCPCGQSIQCAACVTLCAFVLKAVSELRLLVGEEHLQGLSVSDAVAGLYYMTAFR
jgi:hypothetical protein